MKRLKSSIIHIFFLAFILGLTNCAIPPPRSASQPTSFVEAGKSPHKGQITQAELQDDLLRFESQFNARIENASQTLENSSNPKVRYRAALNRLIYGSNSLNIALGPRPESNLLDMVAFIELSHDALKRHWIPNFFGSNGQLLDQAFLESKEEIWAVANKVLNVEQKNLLQKVILNWRKNHPEQLNVETVRLSAFSTEAGGKATELDQKVGGLFASVQQSTQAVDSAKIFAERALYYAERAPFLFRLQARLGVHEIIDNTRLDLAQSSSPLRHERTINHLLKEFQQTLLITRATLGDVNSTVTSINTLMNQLSENPQTATSVSSTLTQLTTLLKEWNHLLSSASNQNGVSSQIKAIADQFDRESNRFLKKLAWLGFGLTAFFWIMFALSQLAYQYLRVKLFGQLKHESEEKHKKKAA